MKKLTYLNIVDLYNPNKIHCFVMLGNMITYSQSIDGQQLYKPVPVYGTGYGYLLNGTSMELVKNILEHVENLKIVNKKVRSFKQVLSHLYAGPQYIRKEVFWKV